MDLASEGILSLDLILVPAFECHLVLLCLHLAANWFKLLLELERILSNLQELSLVFLNLVTNILNILLHLLFLLLFVDGLC